MPIVPPGKRSDFPGERWRRAIQLQGDDRQRELEDCRQMICAQTLLTSFTTWVKTLGREQGLTGEVSGGGYVRRQPTKIGPDELCGLVPNGARTAVG